MSKIEKLDYKKTVLIGFGFLGAQIMWGIYDPYITKILNAMLSDSPTLAAWSDNLTTRFPALLEFAQTQGTGVVSLVPLFIGIIMTFDNVFGVIFQPAFGKLSDRTHSRYGKRSPYIYLGAPISAVLFALIPWMFLSFNSLPALMIFVILFVFIMSLWRAPIVALMPDLTPPSLRSEGNAIINLCGGVGGFLALVLGTVIMKVMGLTAENEVQSFPYVFLAGSVITVICTLVLFLTVKEPDSRLKALSDKKEALDIQAQQAAQKAAEKAEKERLKQIKLTSKERTSLIFMLVGLFFLFCGTNSITTFFALFAAEVLGKSTSEATIMMAVFAVFSMLAAIPAGKLGKKLGRRNTILLGLVMFLVVFVLYRVTGNLAMIWAALVIGGVAFMFITVNTLPLVLEIGGLEKVGTFTGYYYTATFSAQIAAPILFGLFVMFSGTYMSLFVFCPIAFVISLACMLFVRHGEVIPDEVIKEARLAED